MMNKSPIALIALASSVSLAQHAPDEGNIPAPGLFDSQIQCLNRLPSMVPTPSMALLAAETSALDAAIAAGRSITDDANDDDDLFDRLTYVVPPHMADCGGGVAGDAVNNADPTDTTPDMIDDNDFIPADGHAYVVAKGYADTLLAFQDLARKEVAQQSAQKALDDARAAATSTRPNTAAIENAQTALDRANAALETSRRHYHTFTGGTEEMNTINKAGVAEWMAKAVVERRIEAWNDAILGAQVEGSTLDAASYGNYVDLPDKRINTLRNVDGSINYANLVDYVSFNTQGASGIDNFDDDTSLLVVPMHDHDNDAATPEVPVTDAMTIGTIRQQVEKVDEVVKALEMAVEDNPNPLRARIYEDGLRRAKLEQAHWQQQWANALTDDTDLDPVESGEQSIRLLYADYEEALEARTTAAKVLRDAAAAREAKTRAVIDEFSDPASFVRQAVDRREAQKAAADQAVIDASADGGTPSMAQVDAAAAAAMALEEARTAQATYDAIVGDPDGPIDDLVATLLEADGDDGQALVDALSQTYGRTTENREAIDALTSDTDEGAETDGPVTANRKAIDALTADTDEGAEADGPVTTNRKRIDALDGRVTTNETNIATLMEDTMENTQMISRNAGAISTNASNISANAGNIVTNASFINQNAANIAHNGALIDVNSYHIAQNSDRIGANAASIGMNSGMILDNRQMIGEINGQLDMMRAGVAASIAISRMPSIDGGISFGAGVYGGETALAVGFALDHKRTTFDFGVTSSGGEVGAGIGVGVKIWGD